MPPAQPRISFQFSILNYRPTTRVFSGVEGSSWLRSAAEEAADGERHAARAADLEAKPVFNAEGNGEL